MPRLSTDTRAEIISSALELFAANGFERTSLREVAETLGITKAALYYHFKSKDELLAAVVQPLVDELWALDGTLGDRVDDPRRVLEDYFDMFVRHRQLMRWAMHDAGVLARVDAIRTLLHIRDHLDTVLVGSNQLVDRVRAVVALGGLQDCVVILGDGDHTAIRAAAVDAALRALAPPSS